MKIEKAKNFWEWLFTNKGYYLIVILLFVSVIFSEKTRQELLKLDVSTFSFLASLILSFLFLAFPFYIYWIGFNRGKGGKK